MVFNVQGHPLFFWVVERTFGYRPREEDAIELKTEVMMQPARPVLLHNESWMSCAIGRARG